MPQHYYNFNFIHNGANGLEYSNCYLGIDTPQVTLAMIEHAKQQAHVSSSATLLSCTYLGHMTSAQFKAPL